MLLAKRKLNLFGRTVMPGETLTAEEQARWETPRHQLSLQSHLNLGWVEKVGEPTAAPPKVSGKNSPKLVKKKSDEGFEFRCPTCDKQFKTGGGLSTHVRRSHSA